MSDDRFPGWHGTTIVGVRKGGKVVVAGDGQVSLGQTVIKGSARKVRRLSPGGQEVVCGFAGSTARRLHPAGKAGEKSWRQRPANCPGPPSTWPRTGARTSTCATWRPC